tara:strand:- start:1637 stop:3331 length:1695 start_codon:yes stop_codon:yes gene_type:complete
MDEFEKAKSHFDKGVKFFQKKDFENAKNSFLNCLKIAPKSKPTLENLSKTYIELELFDEAEKKLLYLISLNNQNDEIAYKLLLKIYMLQNNYFKVEELSQKAIDQKKLDEHSIARSYLFYPNFFFSEDEIKKVRGKFIEKISSLEVEKKIPELNISEYVLKPVNFELSYDGNDNLKINKKLQNIYNNIYPIIKKLNNYEFTKSKNKKIKIGFISEFFTDHTIMKLFRGIIYKINKDIFDVYVFHSDKTRVGSKFNEIKENVILYNYENIILPKQFEDKVRIVREKDLDILFYPDIHMSTSLYFLTMIKLAKTHITSWGHPETTGNKNINYFLSSKFLETENYEMNYSEKVLLANYLPMYFFKPKIHKILSKDQLTKKKIYFCSQSLIKMHPKFDEFIKKILAKDKRGKVIFINNRNKFLTKQFYKRLKTNLKENFDRVEFINPLVTEEYINKCGSSSVLLDTFWFGAGNSFHESMFYGTPTVTLPTHLMKSRIVTGAYKQMQIRNAPIVSDIDGYVDRSIELANLETKKMLDLKNYYREQADKLLFENENIITDLERIFKIIVN